MKHFLLVAMVLSSTILWAQEVPTPPEPVVPETTEPTEGDTPPPAEYLPRNETVTPPQPAVSPSTPKVQPVEVQTAPSERKSTRTCRSWNLEIGFTNWFTGAFDVVGQNGEPHTLNNFHSRYLALSRNYSTYFPGPFMADFGVSISGHNYAFEDNTTRIDRGGESLEFINNTTVDGRPVISQLGVTHLNAYLVPMLDFGLRIGVGAYAGYRMSSASTLLFFRGDEPHLDRDGGNFYMKPFRYGLRAQIGVRRAQLFMNYDMDEVFIRERGPRLRSFSFGLIL